MSGTLAAGVSLATGLAEQFEGFRPAPYWDPLGRRWTQGFGSTHIGGIGAQPVLATSPSISRETALKWLANEMAILCAQVIQVCRVSLTTQELGALGDFVYNLGIGNFQNSTLLRKLRAGDYAGAADEFDRWDHAGSRVVAGLLRRREAEKALFEDKS